MTTTVIRPAAAADLDEILRLTAARRRQYESYQPRFWRPAPDAVDRQRSYLAGVIADRAVIALVAVAAAGELAGFAIGQLTPAPPVYDPGGFTCLVDDFAVAAPDLWPTVGVALLAAVVAEARQRGAAQVVAITAARDEAKRAALDCCGLSPASEWWVGSIGSGSEVPEKPVVGGSFGVGVDAVGIQ